MARTGAARLAAGAALRAGAGLVTLLSPPDALAVNAAHLTAVMLRRIDGAGGAGRGAGASRGSRALAIGPALGTGGPERALVAAALAGPPALVLDADALTLWEDDPARCSRRSARAARRDDPDAARGRVRAPVPRPRRPAETRPGAGGGGAGRAP